MRILSLPAGFTLLLACILTPAHAANQPPQPTPADSRAAQSIDESSGPGVTIRQDEPQTQVTETRQGGEVTEIKVRKSKNNTYILHPSRPGSAASAQGTHTNPAQWVVKEFGGGKKPKKDKVPPPAPANQDASAPDQK